MVMSILVLHVNILTAANWHKTQRTAKGDGKVQNGEFDLIVALDEKSRNQSYCSSSCGDYGCINVKPFNNLKGQSAGGIKEKVMGSPMAAS